MNDIVFSDRSIISAANVVEGTKGELNLLFDVGVHFKNDRAIVEVVITENELRAVLNRMDELKSWMKWDGI